MLGQRIPEKHFRLMECSDREGGKLWLHRTHQNGLSIDFMTPLKRGSSNFPIWNRTGLWHYLLEFNDQGILKSDRHTEIDFETMATHILALDDACQNHGLKIKKVILKIELKDELFATEGGREIRRRGIYFAQVLPESVNRMHDDHYHIDFRLL